MKFYNPFWKNLLIHFKLREDLFPALVCLQVEYTGPETLLEYTVGQMMLKNMGNNTDSDYAGMKVGLS